MTDDFFRARLDAMIDPKHALAVLAHRLPWSQFVQAVAPCFARKACPGQLQMDEDFFGATAQLAGGGLSNAGHSRPPLRLMIALTLLKSSFDLSDEELVQRFAKNESWQYFLGYQYFGPTPPCDPIQIGRFRGTLGEAGMAIKQTFAAKDKTLRCQRGGYAHAKQFKRLHKVVKRQRTILGILSREVTRKQSVMRGSAMAALGVWLERAQRIHTQQRKDKNCSRENGVGMMQVGR